MKKIRKHLNIPISYYVHYADPSFCKGITKKEGEKANFVELFKRSSQFTLTKMEQCLKATVADLDLSHMLQIKFGSPLFFMENIYYRSKNRPVILTQIYYRADMCSYKAVVEL